jgi:hypothetical protein
VRDIIAGRAGCDWRYPGQQKASKSPAGAANAVLGACSVSNVGSAIPAGSSPACISDALRPVLGGETCFFWSGGLERLRLAFRMHYEPCVLHPPIVCMYVLVRWWHHDMGIPFGALAVARGDGQRSARRRCARFARLSVSNGSLPSCALPARSRGKRWDAAGYITATTCT